MTRAQDRPTHQTDIARQIAELEPWFHNLHLPDGSQTAPSHFLGDFPAYKWAELAGHLPYDLAGWTVLDIGCNAGFYAIELARRGAAVTAIDSNAHYLKQARWAAGQFDLPQSIRFRQMQVYDLADECQPYDLVLFLGVFYHLRYPVLALDIISRLVGRLLAFQTLTMPQAGDFEPAHDYDFDDRNVFLEPGWPKMAFIEHRFNHDPTNWWVPNHAAVDALLRTAGLCVIDRPGKEVCLCRRDPAATPYALASNEHEFESATGRPRRI